MSREHTPVSKPKDKPTDRHMPSQTDPFQKASRITPLPEISLALHRPSELELTTPDTLYRTGSKTSLPWGKDLRRKASLPCTGPYHKHKGKPTTVGGARGTSDRKDKGYLDPIPVPNRTSHDPSQTILFLWALESPPLIFVLASTDHACPVTSPFQMGAGAGHVFHYTWDKPKDY